VLMFMLNSSDSLDNCWDKGFNPVSDKTFAY
jgi:hypothetical protein